jgi:hypothetical protein
MAFVQMAEGPYVEHERLVGRPTFGQENPADEGSETLGEEEEGKETGTGRTRGPQCEERRHPSTRNGN